MEVAKYNLLSLHNRRKDMKIGLIGLGLMGSAMARRLISQAHELTVYNRDSSKTKQFSDKAFVASSPKEVASRSDFVITVVTDFSAASQVMLGDDGIIQSRSKPVVADASTIAPSQSEYLALNLRKNGIEMLGMPVMGGPAAAETGELIPMVAGSRQAFEQVQSVIQDLGKQVFYIGEKDGTANAIKLALNLNIALIATAVSEGITLVKGCGIDPSIFVRILNSTYFKTGLSEKKGPKMVQDDFAPSFHLKNMLKDLELVTSTAQAAGISLPSTAIAQQIFRAANNSGYSEMDYTSICAFLAQINGLKK
jgi:3-hydroxyisobutyrate dehydrogenase